MDGQKLLEWIRAEGLRTPVIMISALGDINDAVKALKSGANDYLIKPFDPCELILKLRTLVAADGKREDQLEAGSRTAEVGTAWSGRAPPRVPSRHDREGGGGEHDGAHHRGKRHGQGSRGPRDPRAFPARRSRSSR